MFFVVARELVCCCCPFMAAIHSPIDRHCNWIQSVVSETRNLETSTLNDASDKFMRRASLDERRDDQGGLSTAGDGSSYPLHPLSQVPGVLCEVAY